MSTITNLDTRLRAGMPVSDIFSMSRMLVALNKFVVLTQNRWTAFSHRKEVKYLSELDDYLLQDIGLERGDLRAARKLPATVEPTRFLESLATERHKKIKV